MILQGDMRHNHTAYAGSKGGNSVKNIPALIVHSPFNVRYQLLFTQTTIDCLSPNNKIKNARHDETVIILNVYWR